MLSDELRFYRDEETDVPCFEPRDDTFSALGSLMTGDIANSSYGLLELLQGVELVRLGKSVKEEWQGNGWTGEILADGLHLQDIHSDDWRGDYSLDLTRAVAFEYLQFLAPDRDNRLRALARWESREGRRHAARDDI